MAARAYISNLSPLWPIRLQEEMLATAVPDWPRVSVYRDVLPPKLRQAHSPGHLREREGMLRPGSRRGGETIYVASLAVLAWTADDMLACLTAAAARGAMLRVLDAGLTIEPNAGAAELQRAVQSFASGRRSRIAADIGLIGAKVSARRREEAAKAKAETIRDAWALPSDAYPTAELLARAGLSRNTAIRHLGKRARAQATYQKWMLKEKAGERQECN